MKTIARVLMLVLAIGLTGTAWASSADDQFFAGTEKFAKGAKNVTEVTLDQKMLQMASGFISKDDKDKDSVDVKRITENLKGVFVRSYEYSAEGQYNAADLEQYRKRLDASSDWSHIVKVRSTDPHGESTDVYMLMQNGKAIGMVVIAAEPRELTFVHIDGAIDPSDLHKLGGNFGIPKDTQSPDKSKLHKKGAGAKSETEPPPEASAATAKAAEVAE